MRSAKRSAHGAEGAASTTGVGVDGCPGGWFAIRLDASGGWAFELHEHIDQLVAGAQSAHPALIDIPIGLPTSRPRRCDTAARRLLSPLRHTSVFPTPCRAALSAESYRAACELNRQHLGTGLSRQTWNICRKIREVDSYLRHGSARVLLRESHPEMCFYGLSGGRPMRFGKRAVQGQAQRLDLLERHCHCTQTILSAALRQYTRQALASDDILDALVLAVAALRPADELVALPGERETDACGLPMEIVYPAAWARDNRFALEHTHSAPPPRLL